MTSPPWDATLLDMSTDSDARTRVVFACVPQAGHLRPLLPLAREFAGRGAEVIVASGPAIRDAVTSHGLTFHQVCPDLDVWFGRLAERTRGRPGDGLAPDHVERYFVPRLFAEIGLGMMIDGLDELVTELGPDLLIFEPYALAAPLVGRLRGVETVQHTIGLPPDPLVAELVEDAVTPAWRAAGLDAPVAAGLTLDVCPPTLAGDDDPAPAGARVQPLRPTPLPDRVAALPVTVRYPDRPLVYVTLGTFANSDLELFRLVLRALAPLPVTVLVTAGDDASAATVGEPPDNAVLTGFVPQAALLPHCAAVIHHAGAGTAFGVLGHGLPSVALPQSADNFSIAERLADSGAARVLMPEELSEAAVREAARAVLTEPGYRAAAERLAAEIAAMPAVPEVVTMLRTRTGAPGSTNRKAGG